MNYPTCPHCMTQIIWQNDFSFEDYGMEDEGIVSVWMCPHCQAMIQVYIPCNPTKEDDSDGTENKA